MTFGLAAPAAPYPGLRSFQRDETEVFFGRDTAVNDMLRRLGEQRFLAVLGASGSGKSSLVRTGMLEGLELGLIARAGSWWRVIDIRPGSDPILALARALCPPDAPREEAEQMRAYLLGGPRSLAKLAETGLLEPGENLLLLVDQFEELFRYRDYDGHQEAEAFVALLLESARARDVPVHVTLTMRSEYLGACALFDGLAEAMNRGQYLTPRLGRDQCRAAIEGPAAVCGFALQPELVTALLNDLARFAPWSDGQEGDLRSQLDMIGRRADQLPLLQHVLNRMWLRARDRRADDSGEILLLLEDYQNLGGLRGAIDQHARSIADTLSPPARKVLEPVFRALTTGTNVAEAVRRPTPLAALVDICGGDRAAVTEVVEAFRATGRSFLMPPPEVPLHDDTIIDITHESLIRQWTDLSAWLATEARDAEAMRRLDEAAAREVAGTGELLDGRDLSPLKTWREETRLPRAWAARYVTDPDRAFGFLDRSVTGADARRKQSLRRRRLGLAMGVGLAGLGVAAVALAGLLLLTRGNLEDAVAASEAARAEAAEAAAEQEAAQMLRDAARRETDLAREAMAEAVTEAEQAVATAEAAARQEAEAMAAADRAAQDRAKAEEEAADLRRKLESNEETSIRLAVGVSEGVAETVDPGDLLDAAALVGLLPPRFGDRFAPMSVRALVQARAFGRPPVDPQLTRQGVGGTGSLTPFMQGALDPGIVSPFILLRQDKGDESLSYAVTDPRSGDVLYRFAVDSDTGGELSNYALSMSGRSALLRDYDGRLLRWEAGQPNARRVLDRAWLTPIEVDWASWRSIQRVAFDETTGEVAIQFTHYDLPSLTILGPTGAAEARIWKMPDLTQLLGTRLGMDTNSDSIFIELLGLRGGELIFNLSGNDRLIGNPASFLVGLVPGTGRHRPITGNLGWAMAAATTDPDQANLMFLAGETGCADGPTGVTFDEVTLGVCTAAIDLATGVIRSAAATIPILGNLPMRIVLPPDPVDPTAPQTYGGTFEDGGSAQVWPPLRMGAGGAGAEMPWLDSWAPIRSEGDGWLWSFSGTPFEVRRKPAGIELWNAENPWPQGIVIGDDGAPVTVSVPSDGLADWPAGINGPIIVAEEGRRWLALDGEGTVWAFETKPGATPPLTWRALETDVRESCQKTSGGQSDEGGASGPAGPVGTGRGPGIGRLVQAVDLDGRWMLVGLKAEGGPLALARDTGDGWIELHCPGNGFADTVLDADLAAGMVAVSGRNGRLLQVWDLPKGSADPPGSTEVPVPDGHSLRAAAFPGDGTALLLTTEGRILEARREINAPVGGYPVLPSGPPGDAVVSAPMAIELLPGTPLSGATLIQARGNRLLLARDLTPRATALASPNNTFSLVALAERTGPGKAVRLTHAAALPLPLQDIAAWRADDEGPLVTLVLGNGYVARVGLPEVPDGPALAEELLTLADPLSYLRGESDPSLSAIGLLVSTLRDDLAEPPLLRAVACAAEVERRLAVMAAPERAMPDQPLPCSDAQALALLDALSPPDDIESVELPFPPRISGLLARAANGDGLALRAALLHIASPATEAEGVGPAAARHLLARLASARPDPAVPTQPSDGTGGDAFAHLRLARAAMDAGTWDDAYRHAWLAEAILSHDSEETSGDQARALRMAAGSRLSAAGRRAVLTDLRVWSPQFLPAPAEDAAADPLEADLAALDRIGAALAAPAEAALLKLARLQQDIASAEPAARTALIARAGDLLTKALTAAGPGGFAETTRPALIAAANTLRQQLDEENDARRARAMDAFLVTLVETTPGGLRLLDPSGLMGVYAAALERLLQPEVTAQAAELAPLLRLNAAAPGFDLRNLTFDDAERLVSRRADLARAHPGAKDAAAVAAGADFWLGVALDARVNQVRADGDAAQADALLAQAREAQVRGLDALMALHEAGGLTSPEALSLYAMAMNWGANDLPADRVLAEAARFDRLDGVLRAIGEDAERSGLRPSLGYPVWNIAVLNDVRINKTLPFATDGALRPLTAEDGPRLLKVLDFAADWLRQSRRGEISTTFDNDSFTSTRWSLQIGVAIGYVSARARSGEAQPSDCDVLASHPFDPIRRSVGVAFASLRADAARAVEQCGAELRAALDKGGNAERVAALKFLYGRALDALSEVGSDDPALQDRARTCYVDAALSGSVMALNNLQNIFDDQGLPLRRAFHEQMMQKHFATAHTALSALPGLTAADRDNLLELARQSAALGSVDTALILGQTEPDAADRAVWLLVAAREMKANPRRESDADTALAAEGEAYALLGGLPSETASWVTRKAEAWVKEPGIDLIFEFSGLYPDPAKTECLPLP